MKGAKVLFLASWIIILVLSVATGLFSLGSLRIAYFGGGQDNLTPTLTVEQLQQIGGDKAVDAAKAVQGRRATAATWAFAYSVIAIFIILLPYRRGEKWAWWALLLSLGLSQILSAARVLTIDTWQGAQGAVTLLAALLIGLLAGVPYIFGKKPDAELE